MKIIFSFFLLIFAIAVKAQGTITVKVSNLKSNNGVARICLFDNAAAFNGEGKPVQCVAAAITNKIASAVFQNMPAGTYAVSVFHDVNSNNKLDVNFLGIPKEGYGASKNKLPFASAPVFAENQFTLQSGAHVQLPIKLRHL